MSRPRFVPKYRYIVTYEDEDTGLIRTFGVYAPRASDATALTIAYIKEFQLHDGGIYYLHATLLSAAKIKKVKPDYEVS